MKIEIVCMGVPQVEKRLSEVGDRAGLAITDDKAALLKAREPTAPIRPSSSIPRLCEEFRFADPRPAARRLAGITLPSRRESFTETNRWCRTNWRSSEDVGLGGYEPPITVFPTVRRRTGMIRRADADGRPISEL